MASFLREAQILSPMEQQAPPEIIYLFLIHLLLIPSLKIHQRAQTPRGLPPSLENVLRHHFLLPVFRNMAILLASRHQIIDIDGTIYTALIALVLSRPLQDIGSIVGDTLQHKAQAIWKNIQGPALNFDLFRSQYRPDIGLSVTPRCTDPKEPRPLLPFTNPVFDDEFSIFWPDTDTVLEADSSSCSENLIKWSNDRHWHNQKSILPRHLGGGETKPTDPKALRRMLRSNQRFMSQIQDQAATLTGAAGAILHQMIIVPAQDFPESKSKPSNTEQKRGYVHTVRSLYLAVSDSLLVRSFISFFCFSL